MFTTKETLKHVGEDGRSIFHPPEVLLQAYFKDIPRDKRDEFMVEVRKLHLQFTKERESQEKAEEGTSEKH